MAPADIDWTIVQPERKWYILRRQTRFALWALYSSVGGMMLGYDYGIAGTATAFPAFQKKMGIPFPSQPSGYLIPADIQSAWAGVSAGGDIVGVLVAGYIMEIIGRKGTILAGTCFTAIGVGMQIGSSEWRLFLGGRLVNAMGFSAVFITCPVWIGEAVRPELRGWFLCIMNCSIVFGQFLLSLVAYGTAKIDGNLSYQLPIILQFVFVAVLLLGLPFFPESPYYCLKRKTEEAAIKSLRVIHGSGDQALLDAELIRMKETLQESIKMEEVANAHGPPLLQAFQGQNRMRTLTAMLPAAGQQLIGASFVLGYVTYFMSLLGISDYFTVSVILFIVMLLSNLSAFPTIEIVGRRPLLLYGMVALVVIELLMGIMGCVSTPGAIWVILVCIFLWAIFYQLTIGAIGFALAAEIPTPQLRPVTLSLVGLTQGVLGWLIGFVSPYMINPDAGNLGAKVGFVFFGLGVPLIVAIFFLVPETKGLSFSDMDHLFAQRVSPRHFQREIVLHRDLNESSANGDEGIKNAATNVTEVEKTESAAV